jgi:anti-sigma28 factor (negative regulator of flagellin synthesis)
MSRADEHFERDEWLSSRSPNFYKIMVVEFNTGGANYIPVRQTSARQTQAAADDDSSVSFSTQSLQQSLKQSAQVRPEKVAQANALLSDGNYPSDAALNQLAGFLANRLQNS